MDGMREIADVRQLSERAGRDNAIALEKAAENVAEDSVSHFSRFWLGDRPSAAHVICDCVHQSDRTHLVRSPHQELP